MDKAISLENESLKGATALSGKLELAKDVAGDLVALAYSLKRIGIPIEVNEVTENISSMLHSLIKVERAFRSGFYTVNNQEPNRPSTNFSTVPQNSAKASFSEKTQNNKVQNEKTE